MESEEIINVARKTIDSLDDQIIALIRARIGEAILIGYEKHKLGLPVRNSMREIEVSQKYKEALGDLGLTVGNAIIKESWQVQTTTT